MLIAGISVTSTLAQTLPDITPSDNESYIEVGGAGGYKKNVPPVSIDPNVTPNHIQYQHAIPRYPVDSDLVIDGDRTVRSKASLLRVLRANYGGFKYSYETHLKANPKLRGNLVLRFSIAPQTGEVLSIVVISSNMGDEALSQ